MKIGRRCCPVLQQIHFQVSIYCKIFNKMETTNRCFHLKISINNIRWKQKENNGSISDVEFSLVFHSLSKKWEYIRKTFLLAWSISGKINKNTCIHQVFSTCWHQRSMPLDWAHDAIETMNKEVELELLWAPSVGRARGGFVWCSGNDKETETNEIKQVLDYWIKPTSLTLSPPHICINTHTVNVQSCFMFSVFHWHFPPRWI